MESAARAETAQRSLDEWLRHLEGINARTIEMGLARVRRVAAAMGLAPRFPIVTVGGTNGKGSVCAMLEAVLACAGYKVGCYTSPHLLAYNERVRVNRAEVDDAALCLAFERIERARGDTPLTYFEFGTLAAMQVYVDAGVDVAILEVGLGGRLDAVNVFDNTCAVVTTVDMDHMEYLGDSRDKIGFEKAGIFRRGRAAICADPDPPASVEQHAEDIGCDLFRIGRDFGYRRESNQWEFWGLGGVRSGLPHPALRGAYQLQNASACIAALEEVKAVLPVSMGDVRRGLLEVRLPGRFQVLPGRPAVILDVAHNPQAARALAENLAAMGLFRSTLAVWGMYRDKDMHSVARTLLPQVDAWYLASLEGPRGAAAGELGTILGDEGCAAPARFFDGPEDAFAGALGDAGDNDRIVVFGSFLTVAGALRWRSAPGATDGA